MLNIISLRAAHMARLFVACLAVAHALYDVRTTYGVTYARGLTNCTNGTNCLASRGLRETSPCGNITRAA